MERKKEERKKVQFIKVGGGSHRFKTSGGKMKIVKPNEKFYEYPEFIPENMRDVIRPVRKSDLIESEKPLDVKTPSFTIKRRSPTSPWHDIVDENGKVINEKALLHDQAVQRVAELS